MNPISTMARHLYELDYHYRALVDCLQDLLRDGRYHRAALIEAVMIADEKMLDEQMRKALEDPPISTGAKKTMEVLHQYPDVLDKLRRQ